jgi:hypothetical protein
VTVQNGGLLPDGEKASDYNQTNLAVVDTPKRLRERLPVPRFLSNWGFFGMAQHSSCRFGKNDLHIRFVAW